MPVSVRQRANWAETWQELAADIAIQSQGTSIEQALACTVSAANVFFKTKAYKNSQTAKEAEAKKQNGIGERLNSLIGGQNVLIKQNAAKPRR